MNDTMTKLGDVARECRQNWTGDQAGVPIVGLEHLVPGEYELKAWDSDIEHTFSKKFEKGQVLLGRRRVYLRKAVVAPCDGICSGDITVIESTGGILPELLPFVIQNDRFFDYAMQGSAGSLSPRVKWDYLKNYEFSLPSLDEQRLLAEKLWSAYRLKESYKKLLAATEEMVKSQFIEMFDFENNSHDWPILSFCDFASLDCTMTTDYEYYSSYPHIGIDSIEQNTGRLFGYRTVKEDNVKSGKYVFTSNHIIYSKIRPNLNKVATPDFNGLCSADSYPILANEEVTSKEFLAYLMRSDVFLRYIVPLSNRTGMPKVNREQVEGFACPFPPKAEQDKFVAILHQADKSGSGTMFRLAS